MFNMENYLKSKEPHAFEMVKILLKNGAYEENLADLLTDYFVETDDEFPVFLATTLFLINSSNKKFFDLDELLENCLLEAEETIGDIKITTGEILKRIDSKLSGEEETETQTQPKDKFLFPDDETQSDVTDEGIKNISQKIADEVIATANSFFRQNTK